MANHFLEDQNWARAEEAVRRAQDFVVEMRGVDSCEWGQAQIYLAEVFKKQDKHGQAAASLKRALIVIGRKWIASAVEAIRTPLYPWWQSDDAIRAITDEMLLRKEMMP